MKTLTNVVTMKELSPNGGQLNYLISGGRVYASARSWARALQVPNAMKVWFETGLIRTALLNKNVMGGELEMIYKGVLVYRWHIVAEQLRVFDRQWYQTQFKGRPKQEQQDIERFHDNYERLVHWGYDLQERALSHGINSSTVPGSPVTQETLLGVIRQAIAPRLGDHDKKLHEQDVVIAELREAVAALRDQNAFISVKQAIAEQGLDSSLMPLYPNSKENLSSLVGRFLKRRGVEQGPNIVARLDGKSLSTEMNTYRRGDIYAALNEFKDIKQLDLNMGQ